MKRWVFKILLGCVLGSSLLVSAVELKKHHPDVYVVQKGDTLWDISARFLNQPWLWPEIWQVNPQVGNPHLIYPGDVLSLVYINGKPRLVRHPGVVKLTPQMHVISSGDAIGAVPLEVIRPFLVGARVVNKAQLDTAPYIVASDGDHLMAGIRVRIYARGIKPDDIQASYALFRPGKQYRDPVTGEILGTEAIHLGVAKLVRGGDPATLDISESERESLVGDRLLPVDENYLRPVFYPHPPGKKLKGQIIAVYEGVTQIGQYNVVILNRGAREGVDVGTVLTVFHRGALVRDRISLQRRRENGDYNVFYEIKDTITGGSNKDKVKLPDEKAGSVMVFRVFDKVSLALVMDATRPMHILDTVGNPF